MRYDRQRQRVLTELLGSYDLRPGTTNQGAVREGELPVQVLS
jgi:hypothetical protein